MIFMPINLAPSLPKVETAHLKTKRRKISETSEQELEKIEQNSESDDDGLSVLSKPYIVCFSIQFKLQY